MAGMATFRLSPPVTKPTGLVIVETDGCFVDGIEVSTGASIGHRTLRVVDMGKIAATFVDVQTGKALRLTPRPGIRTLAFKYAAQTEERYLAQLHGYQLMPDNELLEQREIHLQPSLKELLSTPDARVTCDRCGEEIINQRELAHEGKVLCITCAGAGYYVAGEALPAKSFEAAKETEAPPRREQ